jgi:tellurite resistance protein
MDDHAMDDIDERFPEIQVSDNQADAFARGLYAVARADGEVHPQERALITEFYAGARPSSFDLNALERQDKISAAALAQILATGELVRLFLRTAILCAWADGGYSKAEGAVIAEYATAGGVEAAELAELEAEVKEYMLAQLAHLKNVDAAIEVKKELDL